MSKHKVFISYYHDDDQFYKEKLLDINNQFNLFDDYSVDTGDIDDRYMNDESIRVKIRDEYIRYATVLIVLCGKRTKERKHIDWEISASMYDSTKNPKMGIIVLNLPTIYQNVYRNSRREGELITSNAIWKKIVSFDEIRKDYPFMSERLQKNLYRDNVSITVGDYHYLTSNPEKLKELIEISYSNRKNQDYDTSIPLRRRNS